MSWPFVARCLLIGLVFAAYQVASTIMVMDNAPSTWEAVKLAAAAVIAGIGGGVAYGRDPERALGGLMPKVGKALVLLLALPLLAGCAMNADVINALAKDPATVCVKVTTIYGTMTAARTNVVSGDVTCDNLSVKVPGGTSVPVTVIPAATASPLPVTIK